MFAETESYLAQRERWPKQGRHILASYDDDTIVVYQAYRPEIGLFAAEHGSFGGPFSYSRMSWIKPNFLWMMYRCGWGTKEGQEVVLAVRLKRTFFEEILAEAVVSGFKPDLVASHDEWKQAVKSSEVRLQWDPDHDPTGAKVDRRGIQLGLRGSLLERYGKQETIEIRDVSPFVAAERAHARPTDYEKLLLPVERVFQPSDPAVREKLGLHPSDSDLD
jgi:hypothetical protein